jgi:histidinol-phosphate aminotransferase
MLETLPAYSTERDEIAHAVFLDANESYRQWATIKLSDLPPLNRYPDNTCSELRHAICQTYARDFSPEQVLVSAGSMELIDLVLRGFCKRGFLINEPSYQVYETKALQNNIRIYKVLLRDDFSLDIDALRKHVDLVDVLLLIHPNNPTGNLIRPRDLLKILTFFNGTIIIDEAYIEFAGIRHSLAPFALSHPNVIILRSFSKAWGLAGIRLGYALASRRIIDRLINLKSTYNVPVITQSIGIQVLKQQDSLLRYIDECSELKQQLLSSLQAQGIQTINTHANFILIKVPNSHQLHQHLRRKGILVRHRGYQPLLANMIRITIGTSRENEILIANIRRFLSA